MSSDLRLKLAGPTRLAVRVLPHWPGTVVAGNGITITVNSNTYTVSVNLQSLAAFVGDAGAGGQKGLVPAPVAGDGAAGKTLHADGTWKVDDARAAVSNEVTPSTIWLEMDAFQPGIVVRETSGAVTSFTQQYLREKLAALHASGYRRFIILSITDLGRTYTSWASVTPKDPSNVAFHFWYNDVAPGNQPNVDNFDVLKGILDACDQLEGAHVVVGLGRHDDLNLLNDLADGGADPMRFGKTEATRLSEEITRYTTEAADVVARFGTRRSFGGFYISHESDHLQSSASLYAPICNALRGYGNVHVSVSTPTDFAITNTIADAVNSFNADWLWAQTSAGYGYNWATGLNAYVSSISVFGSAAHLANWRSLIKLARGRSGSSTVTITIAGPGVVTWTAHGWSNGTAVVLNTTGALPTGLGAGTTYYAKNVAANTFELAAAPNGTSITTTGSQSGTHTAIVLPRSPLLGSVIENWRIGVQGVGALTFAATTGTNITVTLGTSSSVVAGDIGKDINVRSGQLTGIARVISITNPTTIKVDITENLVSVNVTAGFWALVPNLVDAIVDAYPAPASEVAIEVDTVSGFSDEVSIYAEAYWDPGNLSLRLKQVQGPSTDYRDRAIAGWSNHAIALSDAANVSRFLAWNNRATIDPIADRISFWDDSAGSGGQGAYGWLTTQADALAISGTELQSKHRVLQSSGVAASVTGTTSETVLATITIPAGAMGANGWVEVYSVWTITNSANNKTLRTRLGGIGGTAFGAAVFTTVATVRELRQIVNRNSQSSQVCFDSGGFNGNTAAILTGAVDTSAAKDLVLTAQLANSGETITLEYYIVRLFSK